MGSARKAAQRGALAPRAAGHGRLRAAGGGRPPLSGPCHSAGVPDLREAAPGGGAHAAAGRGRRLRHPGRQHLLRATAPPGLPAARPAGRGQRARKHAPPASAGARTRRMQSMLGVEGVVTAARRTAGQGPARGRRGAGSAPKFTSDSAPISAGFQQEALHKIGL